MADQAARRAGDAEPVPRHRRADQSLRRGFGDITTRQDIQLHWLAIADFPDCLDRIYKQAGLYTDFACGDTPRNCTSCPLDGVLKNQILPLGDLVQRVSDMFRDGRREFSNLPRKFKSNLAACPIHCHQPQINDVAAFGVIHPRDGRRGLGVMVGGGLSSTPYYADGLRVFVPEEKVQQQIPDIFRHVCHIFRDADELRYKRKRARLKFLVQDKGWEWFRDDLERRLGYELEHDDEIVNPRGALHTDHMGVGEQSHGLYYVGVPIARGRMTGDQMIAAAELAERFAAGGKGRHGDPPEPEAEPPAGEHPEGERRRAVEGTGPRRPDAARAAAGASR